MPRVFNDMLLHFENKRFARDVWNSRAGISEFTEHSDVIVRQRGAAGPQRIIIALQHRWYICYLL